MNGFPAVLCLIAVALAGQPPQQRDSPQQVAGTAHVSGRVLTTGDSPPPVRRAIVSLYGRDHPLGHHAVSDDEGRFTIDSLPVGKYALSAKRASYVTVAYGARRPGWSGTPVALEEGQHLTNLEVLLAEGAVVAGSVRDLDGGPISGIDVWVQRSDATAAGQPPLQRVPTDDRGEYRVFGLAAGEYIVSAHPRPTGRRELRAPTDVEVDAILLGLQRRQGRPSSSGSVPNAPAGAAVSDSVPVYYPGVFAADDAAVVVLRAGEERAGVDVALELMSPSIISGQVLVADGRPMSTVQMTLTKGSRQGAGVSRSGQIQADGSFQFSAVAPGRYLIAAIAMSPEARRASIGTSIQSDSVVAASPACAFATQEVLVTGGEITGLSLSLKSCLKLDIRTLLSGDSAKTALPSLSGIRVTLQPDLSSGTPMYTPLRVPPVPGPDGRFTLGEFGDVLPGVYHIRAEWPSGTPGGGLWLQSATADGRDIFDAPLTLTPGAPEVTSIVLTFTDQHTSLSGRLETASLRAATDHTVIAFPANHDLWRAPFRRVRTARPATDGQYRIDDLPPGDYYLAALTEVAPDEWLDALFLEQIADAAVRVSIAPGERKIQGLRIRK